MPYALYDFADEKGVSIIEPWRKRLTNRSRGQLDSKIDMLAVSGMHLPTGLLAGPINKTKHIYKLKIYADIMLRPMFCKGPFNMDDEFTLLTGAVETQGKLIPDPAVAVVNRAVLLADRKRRVIRA